MTKLTATTVDAAKPGTRVWDDELKGLHLRVTANGVRTYMLAYRNASGRQRWLTLGRHGAITPYEARSLAKVKLGEVAQGGDPAATKQMGRQAAKSAQADIFTGVAERFLTQRKTKLRPTSIQAYTKVLNGVPKAWKTRPVSEITRDDISAFLKTLTKAGKHPMAMLIRKTLNVFFGWCFEEKLVTALPTTPLIKLDPLEAREHFLPIAELRRVLAACDRLAMKGDIVKLLILTGQRRTETSLMKWSDLQGLGTPGALWNLPKENTKNNKPHVVPSPPEAQAIINRQPHFGPYVFTLDAKKPLASATLDKIKHDIEKLMSEDGQEPVELWRLHDLRRSLVTGMNEHELADPHLIELIVNHRSGLKGGIAGVYDKSTRLPARRKALEAWARLLLNPEAADNVVPLRRVGER